MSFYNYADMNNLDGHLILSVISAKLWFLRVIEKEVGTKQITNGFILKTSISLTRLRVT